MGSILLKTLLAEVKLYSYTIPEVLEKILKFEGKTLVLFDTETVGLEPNTSYIQLTHLAAMAVDGSTMQEIGDFSKKVNIGSGLNNVLADPNSEEAKHLARDRERHLIKYKKADKHPSELLQMTGYYSGTEDRLDEKDALIAFEQFVDRYHDVILIAHNAVFDLKTINTRRRIHGLPPMKRLPVLDTLKIVRMFFIPAMISMEHVPEVQTMLSGLLAKTKYKSYSASLGKLAQVLGVKMDNWHDAKEDVKMLFQVLQKVIEFLKKHPEPLDRRVRDQIGKKYRGTKPRKEGSKK